MGARVYHEHPIVTPIQINDASYQVKSKGAIGHRPQSNFTAISEVVTNSSIIMIINLAASLPVNKIYL